METSRHCDVLFAVLSTIMQRTCWLSLAADSPAQQWIQVASRNCFLRINRNSTVEVPPACRYNLICNPPPHLSCRLETVCDFLHMGVTACRMYLYFHRHTSSHTNHEAIYAWDKAENSLLCCLYKIVAQLRKTPQSKVLSCLHSPYNKSRGEVKW